MAANVTRPFGWVGAGAALLFFGAVPALAAAAGQPATGTAAGASEGILVGEVVLLVLCGRLLGEGMQRIGQPAVMGQLVAGILLGPSVFGLLWPAAQHAVFPSTPEAKAMIDGLAQFGILMLLLLAGMETDLSLVRRARRAAFTVSFSGIVVPFIFGFALGEFLPDSLLPDPSRRLITALFLGTALSIASVKIVAMVVREMNFARRNIGQIILASAIIDDTVGWIIVAIIFGLAAHGTVDWLALTEAVVGTLVFLAASFTIGRRIVFRIIRWTNDTFVSEGAVIAAIVVIMGGMAMITQLIGVNTVLGAFVAGILVGQSPIRTKEIDEQIRGLTTALFMPVFFGLSGLKADLTIFRHPDLLVLTAALIVIASLGKAVGAFAGARLGGLGSRHALALAAGMNARGSTEVIVATIGLTMGVLSQNLFTMIVTMAVVTTLAMPPTLRWALARLPISEDEKKRLAREAFEEKAFMPRLNRLLLTVDHSTNGAFAARLAGLIAGRKGMPVTVLRLDDEEPAAATPAPAETEEEADAAPAAVRDAARQAEEAAAHEDEARPETVEVIVPTHKEPVAEAVEKEARKGYDLLVVGLDRAPAPKGGFRKRLSEIVGSFEGAALAVVIGRGNHAEAPQDAALDILVPITGSGSSRRGAELAVALAQAAEAPITALALAGAIASNDRRRRTANRDDAEIAAEIAQIAEHYEVKVNTVAAARAAEPVDAILREAGTGRHRLIVMGVSRRPGETLSFGNLAATLLERSPHSILFVES
jgi:Kef-type K+ transport system membrane component KefB/nucleotide-binding universal stress UspA family protein